MRRAAFCLLAAFLFIGLVGCGGGVSPTVNVSPSAAPSCFSLDLIVLLQGSINCQGGAGSSPFTLRAEWQGPCRQTSTVDVNLGNAPQAFVQAAYCQINGVMPPISVVNTWVPQLSLADTSNFAWHARRTDVILNFCTAARRTCSLVYSNPWTSNPVPQSVPCAKKSKQDVGTVMLFSFQCPGTTNCSMNWTDTHAYGMTQSDPYYYNGYFNPFTNTGFWTNELRDAQYAGLQFVLLNLYGNDLNAIAGLASVLSQETNPVKIALFNDTWSYGNILPSVSLSNASQAAQTIYAAQWKPFFTAIGPQYRYLVNGKPLIYFYSAGTLQPMTNAAAVIADMKQMFQTDFGVLPFVVVDQAFFVDPNMNGVADGKFVWDTMIHNQDTGISSISMNGYAFANGMVRWDSFNRDVGFIEADAANDKRMVKGPGLLQEVLQNGANSGADVLVLESWNDFGDGSQYSRNYDYYYQGQWLAPDYFMTIVRQAICTN